MDYLTAVKKRFRNKVEVNPATKCWIFEGGLCKGYGQISVDGRNVRAHKWFWELVNGPIPQGLEISHVCHNTACVRPHPEHVVAETHRANMQRSAKLGTWDGVKNGNAKLRAKEVLQIRKMYQRESVSAKILAVKFNVSLRTIYYVVSYETYFDLVPEIYGI